MLLCGLLMLMCYNLFGADRTHIHTILAGFKLKWVMDDEMELGGGGQLCTSYLALQFPVSLAVVHGDPLLPGNVNGQAGKLAAPVDAVRGCAVRASGRG